MDILKESKKLLRTPYILTNEIIKDLGKPGLDNVGFKFNL